MACNPSILRQGPLFALLDDEETAVLSSQVEIKNFATRQRIYKMGEPGGKAYAMVSGSVRLTTVDEDTPHQTTAFAQEETVCLEVDRHDISVLLERKPMAGMDMLTVLGRQFHASQQLIRVRAARDANQIIEERETFGERIADRVASFGGSWTFIILFGVVLVTYSSTNIILRGRAWDPYPFILLNLFLSMLAAIQAPIIMMSQNRQDKKDRLRSELDFDVNRRAEAEIQGLARKMNLLGDKFGDVEDLLRSKLSA